VHTVFPVPPGAGVGVGVAGTDEGLGVGVAVAGTDEPVGVGLAGTVEGTGVAPVLIGAIALLALLLQPTAAATAASAITESPETRTFIVEPPFSRVNRQ
jgi:hypothetical protein